MNCKWNIQKSSKEKKIMLVKMLKVLFKNLSKQKNWKIRHCFIARGHDKFSHNPEVPQFSKTSQKAKKWWSPHALKYQLQKTFYKTCHESQSQVFHRLYVISFLHQHNEGFCSPFKSRKLMLREAYRFAQIQTIQSLWPQVFSFNFCLIL